MFAPTDKTRKEYLEEPKADLARALSRSALDALRAAFFLQVDQEKFERFARSMTEPLEPDHLQTALKIARREDWDGEYQSMSDAFRRESERRLAKEIRKLSAAGVRSGRRQMLDAARWAMEQARKCAEAGLNLQYKSKTGAPIPDDRLPFTVHRRRLELVHSYAKCAKTAQELTAGALGLSEALAQNLPADGESGYTASSELTGMLEDMRRLTDELAATQVH